MSAPNPKEDGLRGFMSSTGIPIEWIRRILESDTKTDNLETLIINIQDTTRIYHEPTITPASGTNHPGQQPVISTIQSTLVAEFTLNTDKAYRIFKIPANYVSGAQFHVHWTKESGSGGDGVHTDQTVLWQVDYTVFAGEGPDVNVTPTTILLPDTYDDSGTTTRVMQRTADIDAPGFVANYYVGACVASVTPGVGTPLTCEPALVSVDLTYTENINK